MSGSLDPQALESSNCSYQRVDCGTVLPGYLANLFIYQTNKCACRRNRAPIKDGHCKLGTLTIHNQCQFGKPTMNDFTKQKHESAWRYAAFDKRDLVLNGIESAMNSTNKHTKVKSVSR